MSVFWGSVVAILWKDVLLELRTKDIVASLVVFVLLTVVIFNFTIERNADIAMMVTPGVLWSAFVFAGILALNRVFVLEKEQGSLIGLMLCPVGRDAIYFGKMLGTLVFMLTIELLMYPVFAVLFDIPLLQPRLLIVAFLATLGFASVGTVFAAIAVNTRSREIMLPVLCFPVMLPLIIAAVQLTGGVLNGDTWTEMARPLQILIIFDILFVLVSSLIFDHVLEG